MGLINDTSLPVLRPMVQTAHYELGVTQVSQDLIDMRKLEVITSLIIF
jgi:hypothetical protein